MILLAAYDWHAFFFTLFALLACGFALAVLFSTHIVRMAFYLVLSLGATAGLFFLAGAEFVGAMQLLIYVGGTLVLLVFGVMLTAQQSFISLRTASGEWVAAMIAGGALLALLSYVAISVESWQSPRWFAVSGLSEGARLGIEEALNEGQLPSQIAEPLAARGVFVDGSSQVQVRQLGREWLLTAGSQQVQIVREALRDGDGFAAYRIVPAAAQQQTTPIGLALTGVRVDQLDPAAEGNRSGYMLPFVIVSVHLLVVLVGAAYLARSRRPAERLASR